MPSSYHIQTTYSMYCLEDSGVFPIFKLSGIEQNTCHAQHEITLLPKLGQTVYVKRVFAALKQVKQP